MLNLPFEEQDIVDLTGESEPEVIDLTIDLPPDYPADPATPADIADCVEELYDALSALEDNIAEVRRTLDRALLGLE